MGRHADLFRSVIAAALWGFTYYNTLMMGMAYFHYAIPIPASSHEQGVSRPAGVFQPA